MAMSLLQVIAVLLLVGLFIACCWLGGTVIGHFRARTSPWPGLTHLLSARALVALLLALLAAVPGTVWAWAEMSGGRDIIVFLPTPTPGPTTPPAPEMLDATFDDMGGTLPRCAIVTGRAKTVEGWVLVVGEKEDGETLAYYELATLSDGRFTVKVELGDHNRTESYELTAVWMRDWEYTQLVDATRSVVDNDDASYFGLSKMPSTGLQTDSVKVGRISDAPC
jgi:hypothetical protein